MRPEATTTPDRDRLEQQELEAAVVAPGTARALVLVFLTVLFSVPLLQLGIEALRKSPRTLMTDKSAASAGPIASVAGGRIEVAEFFRAAWQIYVQRGPWQAGPISFTNALGQHFHDFEKRLSDTSVYEQWLRPWVQLASCRAGNGNNKVVVGRDGWLFYRPDVDYVTGPGFLDEGQWELRKKQLLGADAGASSVAAAGEAYPDPRPAILQLQRDCQAAGCRLVVVPVLNKAQLQAAQLTRRLDAAAPLHNADWARFVDELRHEGVDVVDPSPERVEAADIRFLAGDSHWTPEYMDEVARKVAAHIQRVVRFATPAQRGRWRVETQEIANGGDLQDMLHLPRHQQLLPRQTVTLQRVVHAKTGQPWKTDPQADVVLLGDSYTNIYSEPAMKWGEAAGFAPHLSLAMGRDVDVIGINGSGATETRATLARRPQPLKGKKVVVWEFAVRDLAQANWKPIPLGERAASAEPSGNLVVLGKLVTPIKPFRPNPSDTYPNALITLKFEVLTVEQGRFDQSHLLGRTIYMQDHRLCSAATLQMGRTYRLRLEPKTPDAFRTWRMIDDTDDLASPLFWATDVHEASAQP